jgi:hypothetical protein
VYRRGRVGVGGGGAELVVLPRMGRVLRTRRVLRRRGGAVRCGGGRSVEAAGVEAAGAEAAGR